MNHSPAPPPPKKGVCVHCERPVHRGRRGWIHVPHWSESFESRVDCEESPNGRHRPFNDLDVIKGFIGISQELGGKVFREPEQTVCGGCQLPIWWDNNDEEWRSDVHGIICIVGLRAAPHCPDHDFMVSHLQQILEDVA